MVTDRLKVTITGEQYTITLLSDETVGQILSAVLEEILKRRWQPGKFGLPTLPRPTPPTTDEATVSVVDGVSGLETNTTVVLRWTISELMHYLAEVLLLPTNSPEGAPIWYELALETGGDRVPLAPDKALAELGVCNGSKLRIEPRWISRPPAALPIGRPVTLPSGPSGGPPPLGPDNPEFRRCLLEAMDKGLDESEFNDLCFYLDEDHEQFTGIKRDRIRGLIVRYCRHHCDDLAGLVSELCRSFPHVGEWLERLDCKP
jgi:hypothetical protein